MEVKMKRLMLTITFLFITIILINNCKEQNSVEPATGETLYKYSHTHIGPCVYCYTDSVSIPVVGAAVDIYQDSVLIADLGRTDSAGWVHNVKDIMDEGWYTAKAEKRPLYGEEDFYYDLDSLNHIYVEMFGH
jgi:hypothetical protein